MPYKNVVFIKLFLRLFEEDDRFLFQLNESQQLLFIKMLYLAAITDNKIQKNPRFICSKINYHHEEECLFKDLDRICEVFNGLSFNGEFYSFNNFHQLHNYTGKSQGNPTPKGRDVLDKSRVDKIKNREDKDIPPSLDTVLNYCKERKNSVNAEAFINHYQAKGWVVGKSPMKDWRAAVRTWEKPVLAKSDRHYA